VIVNADCFEYLKTIESNSVDLILTDPPYNISRSSNFDKVSDTASDFMKTKYSKHSIDFGDWDTTLDLDKLFEEYYRVLKRGGTLIIFFDVWKSNQLKEMAEKWKFKQPRVGMWLKNNPTPINSKINYLSNAHEFFFTFVKDKKPTFNSEYDNAIYRYPLCHGKERLEHATQKPLILIKQMIEKHSNPDDLVLDTFSGSGTVAEACLLTGRRFMCIERDEKYYQMSLERIKQLEINKI
jgi:site-specific DNA-methyltransferase (adenine-specific)